MPDKKFDPDERFSLYPLEGEEVVKKLLATPKGLGPCEVPGCDREATELRPQQSGDVLRVCGRSHVSGD